MKSVDTRDLKSRACKKACEFKSRLAHQYGYVAQVVEHKTENLGVVGSIPTEATILKNIFCAQSNLIRKKTSALIAQLDRAFDYGSKG